MFLYEILARRARAHSRTQAFTSGGRTCSFGEWFAQSAAACAGLLDLGVGRGDRVLLAFPDTDWAAFAACFTAVTAAGAVAVPVRPGGAPHMEIAGVITGAGVQDDPGPGGRWRVPAAELTRVPGQGLAAWPARVTLSGDDPASILFTSGTTGSPRAVVCRHGDLAALPDGRLPGPQRRAALSMVAIGTNAAQAVLCSCLENGVHTVLVEPAAATRIPELITAHNVAALSLVPTTARLVADAVLRAGTTLPAVRSVVSSSGPLDRATVTRLCEAFPSAVVRNVFTMAEGGVSLVAECSPDRPPAIGRLRGGVRVVDEHGADVAAGQTGELWLRAGPTCRSYLDGAAPVTPTDLADQVAPTDLAAPAGAGTRFLDHGWIGTGDLCRVDADGQLYYVDRVDDVIVSGGVNIASAAVEAVLREHPLVHDVAVFGVAHDSLGKLLVAAVVPADPVAAGTAETAPELLAELTAHCARRLPPEQVPRDVVSIDELPLTASGKVRKRQLVEWYQALPPLTADRGGATSAERAVIAVIRETLQPRDVDRESNFFRLGGNSLLAVHLAAELTRHVGEEVPAEWVLRYPVVKDLALALAR